MANFDASARETCIVRESRTNTPLQALNLMNDVTYLEASRKLAERMMKEGGDTSAGRISHGFRIVTARQPRAAELEVLSGALRYHLDRYQTSAEDAAKLLSQGESPRDPALNVSELAAYSIIANLIFNLDEAITKE
jgi:hypothetical protein